MRGNKAFLRKVIYFCVMAALLIPLSMISRPATISRSDSGEEGSRGGVLAQLRVKHELSQAQLGDIDPAGETMKLAMLGMRGVAANILWTKANEYKATKNWSSLDATINQITKVQPNFIQVWEFQGHNLAYNVSAEFDDYRHRYHYVKEGILFLIRGVKLNRNEPRLLTSTGRVFGNKIGRSDEKLSFRRVFRADDDFHSEVRNEGIVDIDLARDNEGFVDNWRTARLWYLEAQKLIDNEGVLVRGESALLFHHYPAKMLIEFAEAYEQDGHFGRATREAWQEAEQAWRQYGNREIPTPTGGNIHLNDFDSVNEDALRLVEELDSLVPGKRQELVEAKRSELTDEQREALDLLPTQRTAEQHMVALDASAKIVVSHSQLARLVPTEQRAKAMRLASRAIKAEQLAGVIRRSRTTVNFEYWMSRCEIEQKRYAIDARRLVHKADQLFRETDLVGAKQQYELAWDEWAKIFENYPSRIDDPMNENLIDSIKRYGRTLGQLDEPLPADFKLKKLLEDRGVVFGPGRVQGPSDEPKQPVEKEDNDTSG